MPARHRDERPLVAQEAENVPLQLQLGLVDVEIKSVEAFEFERDVFLDDVRNASW